MTGRLMRVHRLLLVIGILFAAAPVLSEDRTAADGLSVSHPFARATPGRATVGAAFLVIRNGTGADDHLVGARSDRARNVEMQTHLSEDGIMRMRPVRSIRIPAGGTARLRPGGDHLMFMGLTSPLREGEEITVTLQFENAGSMDVTVPVGPVGARSHE